MDKTLVILAAGIGSRYGGLKQMDPMGPSGEFIIDYSVYDALRAGFQKVVFIIRHDIEETFRASIGARIARHVETAYAFQELDDLPAGYAVPEGRTKPWGTVQAVLACRGLVNGPFAAINADDFYGRDAYAVLARTLNKMQPDSTDYCMVGFMLRNTLSDHGSVTRGICQANENGHLQSIVEAASIIKEGAGARLTAGPDAGKRLTGEELSSMNFWGFTPALFPQFERQFEAFLATSRTVPKSELVIPTAIGELVAQRHATVRVMKTTSAWFGITNPQDRVESVERIAGLVAAGEYPSNLWA